MAHVGKQYKLHFRRDLVVANTNHNRSLAETYTGFGGFQNSPPFGLVYVMGGHRLFNITTADQSVPTWQSNVFTRQGYDWQLKLFFQSVNNTSQLTMFDLQIFRGGVLSVQFRGPNKSIGWGREIFNDNQALQVIYHNPSHWPLGVASSGLTFEAVRW